MDLSNSVYSRPTPAEHVREASWVRQIGRYVLNGIPVCVGLVFLYFGVAKVVFLNPTIISINYLLHRLLVAKLLAFLVTSVDIYLALSLLFASRKKVAVLTALCCLCVYTCFLAYLVSMKHPPDCGCGGRLQFFVSNRANAAAGLGRNLILIGLLASYYRITFWSKPSAGIPN